MTMRAMHLEEPADIKKSPLKMIEKAIPQPGPGQVRVRTHVCGVCHTDLHTVEGDLELSKTPIIPGHQIVGHVDALGQRAERFSIGQRVGVAWLNSTCGICDYCRSGRENLCPDAKFTGLDVDGGYADYAIVDEDFAFKLPDRLTDDEVSPLLCAGIIGYRSLLLSGIQPGGKIGLFGFGASAHLAIQVARHWGCEVYVFTRSSKHQQHALELGASWVAQAQNRPPNLLDAVITFAPAGWIIPYALDYLLPGGTLAINAIHMSPIPELAYDKIYHERVLRSVANFTRQDAQEFLDLAARIPIVTSVERYPIIQANKVLQRLKRSQIRGAAVLQLRPNME